MANVTTKNVSKNALPILAYYDIFKNYYANTQEENFYIIGNSESLNVALKSEYDTVTKEEAQWDQVNPSCLLAYLGIRGFANMTGVSSKDIYKNALPILAYYDIFKKDRKSVV